MSLACSRQVVSGDEVPNDSVTQEFHIHEWITYIFNANGSLVEVSRIKIARKQRENLRISLCRTTDYYSAFDF